MNILITGNPSYGVASGLAELYPDAVFCSRNSDIQMDLTVAECQDELAEHSLEYDVFINNALLNDFDQCSILQKVWTCWKENGHTGHIINCGSAVDYMVRPDNRLYSIGKKALRDLSRNLSLHAAWECSGIRCTYISFGGVSTEKTLSIWPHFHHMTVHECAANIKYVIDCPKHINMDELHFTPVQPYPKEEMKRRYKENGNKIPSFDREHTIGTW